MSPRTIPDEPIANAPKPIPIKLKPIPYFILAPGLYLLLHHFENNGAKIIMNNEFKIPNHEAFTSISLSFNCLILASTILLFSIFLDFYSLMNFKVPFLSVSNNNIFVPIL